MSEFTSLLHSSQKHACQSFINIKGVRSDFEVKSTLAVAVVNIIVGNIMNKSIHEKKSLLIASKCSNKNKNKIGKTTYHSIKANF